MSDNETVMSESEADALVSRVHLIEDQPLDERAAAFAQVHNTLQATLEGTTGSRG